MPPNKRDSVSSGRARVRKACQRCKVKKTKCDGSYPCEKCREADEPCVYSPKKRIENRPKPRGYMELLEEQQKRMSSGLRRMYKRLKDKGLWEGNVLIETDQSPSIVDILAELDLIEPPEDDESVTMSDEETPPKEESTPTFSPTMCISHGDINVTGVDSQVLPRDTLQGTEPLDTIDWDMAMVFTPLPITPSFTQDNYARPDLNPCSCSLRDYSNQIFDAQAQQANLGLLAPITDLPTSSRYLQHSF